MTTGLAALAMLAGLACAAGGGELFVRGAVGLARAARIRPGIIGATVAAFATSSPELAVAIVSAAEGVPALAFGNVLGANVVNLGLILGLGLLFFGMRAPRAEFERDIGTALLAPVLTALLVALDGRLDRIDGALLLLAFLGWLVQTVREARRERSAAPAVLGEGRPAMAWLEAALGLALLALAGWLVAGAAPVLGAALGLTPFVVGATLVAIGTTLPEAATMLVARLRGHDEVGIGTLLGSTLFNSLVIVGVTALIRPFPIALGPTLLSLTIGALLVLLAMPGRGGQLGRPRGAAMLLLYLAYLLALLPAAPTG
ncbi:MAG: hypothetical protein K2X74_00265 [Acetobacteraceae bacterium]|nr:hypothetical protein [Acetobacteraceae bacterium]